MQHKSRLSLNETTIRFIQGQRSSLVSCPEQCFLNVNNSRLEDIHSDDNYTIQLNEPSEVVFNNTLFRNCSGIAIHKSQSSI